MKDCPFGVPEPCARRHRLSPRNGFNNVRPAPRLPRTISCLKFYHRAYISFALDRTAFFHPCSHTWGSVHQQRLAPCALPGYRLVDNHRSLFEMPAASTSHLPIRKDVLRLADGHNATLTVVGSSTSPILLFVVGSSGFGRLYHRLALELSAHFQCAYYDKRGFSSETSSIRPDRSRLTKFTPVGQHAADAAAVIQHLSPSQPVHAFGTSTGGTAVLDLLAQRPDLVHTAILHEPILLSLMPADQGRDEIIAEYHRIGGIADPLNAMTELTRSMIFSPGTTAPAALTEQRGEPDAPPLVSKATWPRVRPQPLRGPLAVHNARQTQLEGAAMLSYRADVDRARQLRDRIIILGGVESRDWPISVMGRALAGVLGGGKSVWDAPGDHASFASRAHVRVFAETLLEVLQREGRSVDDGGREGGDRGRAKI